MIALVVRSVFVSIYICTKTIQANKFALVVSDDFCITKNKVFETLAGLFFQCNIQK